MGRVEIRVPVAPLGFPCSSVGKESACNAGELDWVRFLSWEGPLEKETEPTLAWRVPRTEEPGRLQSMASQESDTT